MVRYAWGELRLVRLRKDTKAIPFPRRPTRTELERFWMKLQEDVLECGEIMPNTSEFDRKFAVLTYDSFEEACENYRRFRDSICRGEEYQLPEKYTKIPPLGKSMEDEIIIVTARLHSWITGRFKITNKPFSIETIIEEVSKVRGTKPSPLIVKNSLKKGWRQHKGIILENEEELSHFVLVNVPKEDLEKIVGESLPEYT